MKSITPLFARIAVGAACAALTGAITVYGGRHLIKTVQEIADASVLPYACGSMHGAAAVNRFSDDGVEFVVRRSGGPVHYMSLGVLSPADAVARARRVCSDGARYPHFFEKAARGSYECIGPAGEALVTRESRGRYALTANGQTVLIGGPEKSAFMQARLICLQSDRRHVIA